MKGDLPAAAYRLLAALPVRTHEARIPSRQLAPQQRPGFAKSHKRKAGRPLTVVFGKGGKARPVRIDGVQYESATDAAGMLRKSTRTIYEWLRSGQARYA